MRVMVLVKASEESEAGVMPSKEELTEMGKFNEELVNAGIMLAGEGLHPTSKGVRVQFPERKVVDGPFTEAKELVNAGIMLAGEGLHPTSKGVRVEFPERKVVDGPFTETKELLAGYWLLQVRSMDEAIEWIKRAPFQEGEVEIRPVFEADDFGEAFTPELREQEERLRAQAAGNQ